MADQRSGKFNAALLTDARTPKLQGHLGSLNGLLEQNKAGEDKPPRSSGREDKESRKESKTEVEIYIAVQDEAVLFVCKGRTKK